MAWTINGSNADTAGIHVATVEVGTGMVDRAILETADDWDGTGMSYGDWVSVAADGTVILWGMITSREPYAQAGGAQGIRYEVSGPGWHLEITPYTQPFYYATGGDTGATKPRSKCWVGVDPSDGERCNTNQAAGIVLDAAIAAGVPISYNLDFTGVEAPPFEMQDGMCSQALMALLRWHPGLVMFWRYTSSAATLHIKASLGAASFACTDDGSVANVPISVSVQRRDDMAPAGVIIRWERADTFALTGDTSNVIQRISEQTESAGTSTPGPGVLMFTVEIKGGETQYAEQQLICRTVPDDETGDPGATPRAKILKWYQRHLPALAALPAAAMEIEEHTRTMDLPAWNSDDDQRPSEWPEDDTLLPFDDATTPEDLPRELVEGTVPEWAPWIKAEPMMCRLKVRWTGEGSPTEEQLALASALFGPELDQSRTFDVQYTGTNARSKRYKGLVKFIAPEDWPASGLAAAVYNSLSARQYEGRITAVGASSMTTLLPGTAITLTGGRTGSGVVQKASFDAASRRTTVQFGAAGHLGVPDFIELMRANRLNGWTANYAKERQTDAQPTSKGAITGGVRGPRSNAVSVDGGSKGGHPFFCSIVSEELRVVPGTVNGVYALLDGVSMDTIPAPTLPVSMSGTYRVYLALTSDLTFEDDFLISYTPIEAVIGIGATVPEDDVSGGLWHIIIATFVDGVVTAQPVRTSLAVRVCDGGANIATIEISRA